MYSCFFISSQSVPDSLGEQLDRAVQYLVSECEVSSFIVGSGGEFDKMTASAVAGLKRQRQGLFAYQLLPYTRGQADPVLPEGFDGFLYEELPHFLPAGLARSMAAERMLRRVGVVVCCRRQQPDRFLRKAMSAEAEGKLRIVYLSDF